MKCPYCGHENNEDAVRCEHCYAGLQENKQKRNMEKNEPEPASSFRKRIRS